MGISILKLRGILKNIRTSGSLSRGQSKGAFHGIAVIDDMIVEDVLYGHGVFFQVGDKLFAVEDFLGVICLPGQFDVAVGGRVYRPSRSRPKA